MGKRPVPSLPVVWKVAACTGMNGKKDSVEGLVPEWRFMLRDGRLGERGREALTERGGMASEGPRIYQGREGGLLSGMD